MLVFVVCYSLGGDLTRLNVFPLLTACGLVGLVQPMLWDYNPNLDVEQTGTNGFLCLFPFTKYQCVFITWTQTGV